MGTGITTYRMKRIEDRLETVEGAATPDDFAGAGSSGLVPDPGSETGTYLKDDGTWDTPAGGSGLSSPQVLARAMGA